MDFPPKKRRKHSSFATLNFNCLASKNIKSHAMNPMASSR